MPNPRPMETEREFLSRCIPYMNKEENRRQDVAAAICYSKYRREGTEAKSPQPNHSRNTTKNSSHTKNMSYENKKKKAHLLMLLD